MTALLAFVCVFCSLSAQKVNETVALFGKDQLQGFTINVDKYDMKIVEGAMANLFEDNYKLKGSKKKGYHVYENQSCNAFGEARYDIYFTTAEVGKKKNKAVQLTLVVSTGNMNCITFSNDPRTSRNIVAFLESFPMKVEQYSIQLRIQELENKLANLNKEKQNLLKDKEKTQNKIDKTTEEISQLADQIKQKSSDYEKLQESFNESHDPAIKEQLSVLFKEKEKLQKNHSSSQKSLLDLNNSLVKLNAKLEKNAKEIEEAEKELKTLK